MASTESPTSNPSAPEGDLIQPYVAKAKATIELQLEAPELEAFLRHHIEKIQEWGQWSESARQTYVHMMTAQYLQRQATATHLGIGQPFKLPEYSAIKNLSLLLQRRPLPAMPKKKRKKKSLVAATTSSDAGTQAAATSAAPAPSEPAQA